MPGTLIIVRITKIQGKLRVGEERKNKITLINKLITFVKTLLSQM